MKKDVSATGKLARIGICLLLVFQAGGVALAQKDPKDPKPVVLVPPFENQSKVRHNIQYDVTGKRSFTVDRFTEAPRSLFEDILTKIDGVTVVERKRVDAFLTETEFGAMSGLVDQDKAVKLGKLLGANLIVMGTITGLREETRDFNGYGVRTKVTDVQCQMRVRLLDIASGTIKFSKVYKGNKTYMASSFGKVDTNDRNMAAVEETMKLVEKDEEFAGALFGKKVTPKPADGMVEVDFSPKPENCDIEIDGKYVGGSPLKRRLPAGKDVKVRIVKDGYKEWEGVIVPEEGLKITRELGASNK